MMGALRAILRWFALLLLLVMIKPANAQSEVDTIIFPGKTKLPDVCSHPACKCGSMGAGSRVHEKRVAVCNCIGQRLELTPDLLRDRDVTELRISGTNLCGGVRLHTDTFNQSRIKNVVIKGPMKLTLNTRSFRIPKWTSKFRIAIDGPEDLQMASHTFSGGISHISIANTTTTIRQKTFVGIREKISTVSLHNLTLHEVAAQAFSGSHLSSLSFTHCRINKLHRNAIKPDRLGSLTISSCSMDVVQSAAVQARMRRLDIIDNQIGWLPSGALVVSVSELVRINDNNFTGVSVGGFEEITLSQVVARFEFHDNRLEDAEPGALRFSSDFGRGHLSLAGVALSRWCSCDLENWLALLINEQQLVESLAVSATCRLNGDQLRQSVSKYLSDRCGGNAELSPPPPPLPPSLRQRGLLWLVVGAVVGLLVVCFITALVCWRLGRRRRRTREARDYAATSALMHRPHKLNNTNIYSNDTAMGGTQTSLSTGVIVSWPPPRRPVVVAVPDVKTYTETEVHVVLETLECLEPTGLTPGGNDLSPERFDASTPPWAAVRHFASGEGAKQTDCRKSCPL